MQVWLRVLTGKSAGKVLHVPYEEFLIGRSDVCHLRPKSDAISRKHCRLLIDKDHVWVEDLGSRNGTYVNDERIKERRALQAGDKLRIGRLEFELILDKKAAVAQPLQREPVEIKEDTWADDDITRWLEEAAAADSDSSKQLRLDPAERTMVDTALSRSTEETAIVGIPEGGVSGQVSDAPVADKADDRESTEKTEQKKPAKLPPRNTIQAASSGEAAAMMLKKFFSRP